MGRYHLGEIVIRGNNVMLGYYKQDDATDQAFFGGWFHSGDLAVVHPTGYIEIKDRSKDVIISGGENISSVEVENVIYQHPDVLEVAVVGPDPKWGRSAQGIRGAQTRSKSYRRRYHCLLPSQYRPIQSPQDHRIRRIA